MSTRCQLGVFKTEDEPIYRANVLLYRHSDGYPGKADGSEYGVLADIVPFLKDWNKTRGISDQCYTNARLMQYLCNQYDKAAGDYSRGLGHGIDTVLHGDIDYFYHISPTAVKVYKVTYGNNGRNGPSEWKLTQIVSLS